MFTGKGDKSAHCARDWLELDYVVTGLRVTGGLMILVGFILGVSTFCAGPSASCYCGLRGCTRTDNNATVTLFIGLALLFGGFIVYGISKSLWLLELRNRGGPTFPISETEHRSIEDYTNRLRVLHILSIVWFVVLVFAAVAYSILWGASYLYVVAVVVGFIAFRIWMARFASSKNASKNPKT